jgi:glycopeptide antibiotics resistance protein
MDIVINGLAIDIWPIGGLALVAVLAIQFFRKNSWMYLICSFLFGVYILLGLKEVFFPIHINGDYVNVMRQESLLSRINIIPLYFNQFGLSKGIFINILQNIVLTIPLGFGLNFIKSLRVRNFLVLAFIVGIGS